MADTHASSRLQLSFTALSVAFSGKADQINPCILTLELFLASVAACDKIPALPPNVIIQWIEVGTELGPLIISDEVKAI